MTKSKESPRPDAAGTYTGLADLEERAAFYEWDQTWFGPRRAIFINLNNPPKTIEIEYGQRHGEMVPVTLIYTSVDDMYCAITLRETLEHGRTLNTIAIGWVYGEVPSTATARLPEVTVKRLTGSNITALNQLRERELVPSLMDLGKTVATWRATATDAAAELKAARDAMAAEFGSRSFTCRSLWAVQKKLQDLAETR